MKGKRGMGVLCQIWLFISLTDCCVTVPELWLLMLGSKVGQALCKDAPPYKADAALYGEFVSDTDQAHLI